MRKLIFLAVLLFPGWGSAQNLDAETLDLIGETARQICGDFERGGFESSSRLEGEARAALKGLAGRLVDLGVSGAGEINESEYAGVLRTQLGDELKDVRSCRLQIWNDLKEKLSYSQPNPRPQPQPQRQPQPQQNFELAGLINFGPYINCIATNSNRSNVLVRSINYQIFTNFGTNPISFPCSFNCVLGPGITNTFTGPPNDFSVMNATCSLTISTM